MKKIGVVLSFLVALSASAFALNAEAPAVKNCSDKKAAFEKQVNAMDKDSFIVQYVVINLADNFPAADEEAAPLAQCYATYYVKGKLMTQYMRENADIFRGEAVEMAKSYGEATVRDVTRVYDDLQQEILDFAGRVEALNEKVAFDEMAKQDNDYFIAQNILINLADPFATLTDKEAVSKAKVYGKFKVKGEPMLSFVEKQAREHAELGREGLDAFAPRVAALAAQ